MKTLLLLRHFIFILLCIFSVSNSFAQNEYYKVYGTADDDRFYQLEHCSDGGYYILGQITGAHLDPVLIRTDASGIIVWQKIIQVFDSTTAIGFRGGGMLSDETYVLIFVKFNPMYQPTTILIRLDQAGDTLWKKEIFEMDVCCNGLSPIIPWSNGEFLLAGRYQYLIGDIFNGCIMKIDAFGNLVFKSTYSPAYSEVFITDYLVTPDSEIVAVGTAQEPHIITRPNYAFILKMDMNGNIISDKLYQDSVSLGFENIVYNPDNTYTVNCYDQLFLKIDTAGSIISVFKNVGTENINEIAAAPDSGYLVQTFSLRYGQLTWAFDTVWTRKFSSVKPAGGFYFNSIDKSFTVTAMTDTITNIYGNEDGVLLHIDSTTNLLCAQTESADIYFQSSSTTMIPFDTTYSDGLTGTQILPYSNSQFFFQSGSIFSDTICSPLAVHEINDKSAIAVFPNPVSQNTFKIFTGGRKCESIRMMTLDGKIIEGAIQKTGENKNEISLTLSPTVPNGIYIVIVSDSISEIPLKLIVMR